MSDKPKSTSDLVSAALGGSPPGVPKAPTEPTPAVDASTDVAAQELIDLYFVLEEPAERDAVFDRILELQSPVVNAFLSSMMENDEDEFMRASAAAELARRGDEAGISALESELREPTDSHIFAMAVESLIELRGAGLYDLLQAIWRNPSYDSAERMETMLGMENADALRAMDDFVAYVDAQKDVSAISDEQLEAVLASFVRCGHIAAKPSLEALRARILADTKMDAAEREELAALVQEGLDLLEADVS